ncbi:MAG: hypothetical protein OXK79_01655, partial [Chloroflexota bacterium]|nr:hypothetical protein [Chloroflexota bacterium]
MKTRYWKYSVAAVVAAAILAVVGIACAAEEPDDPAQPAAARAAAPAAEAAYPTDQAVPEAPSQVQQQPAPAAPAMAPQQPEAAMAPQAVGGSTSSVAARTGDDSMMDTMEAAMYMPEKIEPGSFGRAFHIISGTSNENFPQVPYKESPMSAAAVKAGTILPVDQRLPDWQNVFILPPGDEIGVYGGSLRTTRRGNITQTDMGMGYGLEMSPDGLLLVPSVFRVFESNDAGDEFTFMMRNGARWSDGHPHTMEDIRFA